MDAKPRNPKRKNNGKSRSKPNHPIQEQTTKKKSKGFQLERGSHIYGVRPLGNMFLDGRKSNVRDLGLGSLKVLPDPILLQVFGFLEAKDLCRLALVSKGLYVFSHQEELWKTLVLEKFGGSFEFLKSWRLTFLKCVSENNENSISHSPLKINGFYSDYLFQSWLCASLKMKPDWLLRDNIIRKDSLSVEDFINKFEDLNCPVIIKNALSTWNALTKWNRDYLLEVSGEASFAAGPVDFSLKNYFIYADGVQEERPLYLFDPRFGEKVPQLVSDYEVPVYFQDDLFSVLGKDRPDYRWLIIGPERSGSSWHVDPNSTSAWNAVVRGAKKWILYPPGTTPPGVHPSPDGADVAAPVSIAEWFMNFYDETKKGDMKPVEGICREGEVLFVPHGWWHMVVNLEESIAITQNYVSKHNLLKVLEFLKRPNACALVSGTQDRQNLHHRFRACLESQRPGLVAELEMKAQEKEAIKHAKSAFWDNISDTNSGGFRFGF